MPSSALTSLATTGAATVSNLNLGSVPDNIAVVEVSGTFTGITAAFQGTADGTNWANIPGVRLDTLAIENTPTVSNSTIRQWKCDLTGQQQFRLNVSALSTGPLVVQINTTYSPNGIQVQLSSAGSLSAGATTITSTSATSLVVGPNGTTNPVFTVDDSTASAATGLKVKGAAAAAGVALTVTTSGTNENLTIDAAGSGTISLNNVTGTGNVILGDAINVQCQTTTGTKIGTTTLQKIGFYNVTPVVQPVAATGVTTGTTGSSTGVSLDTSFKGASGSSAYTITGIVTSLKALGLLAA